MTRNVEISRILIERFGRIRVYEVDVVEAVVEETKSIFLVLVVHVQSGFQNFIQYFSET